MQPVLTRISHLQCLPLRQAVLWPTLSEQQCTVPGDESARHYGFVHGQQLVCCLSLFELGEQRYQVRKFATAHAWQQQGLGSALLRHVINEVQAAGGLVLTLSARETAMGFYGRFGFTAVGQRFEKNGVGYRTMHRPIDQA